MKGLVVFSSDYDKIVLDRLVDRVEQVLDHEVGGRVVLVADWWVGEKLEWADLYPADLLLGPAIDDIWVVAKERFLERDIHEVILVTTPQEMAKIMKLIEEDGFHVTNRSVE